MMTDRAYGQYVAVGRTLLSEHGENPEYDRAIVEMTTLLFGLPMDARHDIHAILRPITWHVAEPPYCDHCGEDIVTVRFAEIGTCDDCMTDVVLSLWKEDS